MKHSVPIDHGPVIRGGHPRFVCCRWLLIVWLVLCYRTTALAQTAAATATTATPPATTARPEALPANLSAQTAIPQPRTEYYYYDPDGVGAHAFYNPQNFIVQGGLGALYTERIDRFDWLGGFATVSGSLSRPLETVDDYGWKRFFWREFVPHLGPGQNYVPNWVWHFTGGGMRTKLMEEYFAHRGFKQARLWAWLTLYSYHTLNEAVQAAKFSKGDRYTVDAIADMYFFDWAGGLFFQIDAVNRFMSGTLHMREWSFQAQYNPITQRLFNNGQLYWLRLEIIDPISVSFLTGEQITSLNLTFEWGQGRQLSAGVGPHSKGFVARKNGDTDPSEIVFNAGLYYSIRDNPFVTLTYEPKGRNDRRSYTYAGKTILNVYPGWVKVFDQPIGMTLAYHQDAVFAGCALGMLPAALGFSTPQLDEIRN